MKLRAPAVPLITVDPFFSVWSPETDLNFAKTMHWTGKSNSLIGTLLVDGVTYSFLGYQRNLRKMTQVSLDIDALSTRAVFENGAIRLPFSSLAGVGDNAAHNLANVCAQGELISREELQRKSMVSKTVMEVLDKAGVLDGLSETNQITFFCAIYK